MEGSPNTSADIFANSSTETIAENKEPRISTIARAMELNEDEKFPPPPVIDQQTETSLNYNDASMLVNEFITDSNLSTRICCPFCILDFGFDFILKDHIKKCHARELKIVIKCNPEDINFHQCPFCKAKFYIKELLPKHIIRKHEICVVNMFSGFSPEKYVYCRFCPHKSLRKHYKLLMIHIEQKHFKLFEKFIVSKYSDITKSFEDIINLESGKKYVSPGLSKEMAKLTTKETNINSSPSIKSILKPSTSYPIDSRENLIQSPEPSIYQNLNVIKRKKTRRTLRFDLPDSPEFEDKENHLPKKLKLSKCSKWKLLISKGIQTAESPLSISEVSENQHLNECKTSPRFHFMCGLCSDAFDMNVKLLEHLRRKHKGLKLQAQYKCGECKAKFYRNSFLVRHCWFHHGPLCLKSPGFKDDKLFKF